MFGLGITRDVTKIINEVGVGIDHKTSAALIVAKLLFQSKAAPS